MRRALVLTISDSVHAGTRVDLSGPAVAAKLGEAGWQAVVAVVPDDRAVIAARLREAAQTESVIFTTGGTGVAPRDVTPEATRDVIERELPGFGEWMRFSGRTATPRSILSRATAGIIGHTLIVNLPGSPAGATGSLQSVLDLVPHVIDLIEGNTEHRTDSETPSERATSTR